MRRRSTTWALVGVLLGTGCSGCGGLEPQQAPDPVPTAQLPAGVDGNPPSESPTG